MDDVTLKEIAIVKYNESVFRICNYVVNYTYYIAASYIFPCNFSICFWRKLRFSKAIPRLTCRVVEWSWNAECNKYI